jgi:microcystin-dependent protein
MGELKVKVNGTYIPAGWVGGASPILAWPVGSIFMSVVPTDPAILLGGGTWVRWGQGRMAVSLDEGQTEFDSVEETGGEKTHTLTTAEIPGHTHGLRTSAAEAGGYGLNNQVSGRGFTDRGLVSGATTGSTDTTASGGGGAAHNNLPPYITCYMWKRTA